MPPVSERELKIELDIVQPGSFRAKFTFDDPDSDAAGGSVIATVSLPPKLADLPDFDPADDSKSPYGQALSAELFEDRDVLAFYNKVAASAFRLRLFCNASAQELHNLRWELLCDPNTGRVFSINENTPFSRFVTTSEWRTVHLTKKSRLRALIAVANPSDLEDRGFGVIDVHGEITRAWLSLAGLPVPTKPDPALASVKLPGLVDALQEKFGFGGMEKITVLGHEEHATVDNILREIATDVDIVYLVCHGSNESRPILYLQNAEGETAAVDGLSISNKIRTLKSPPRLVVLGSCESAGANGRFAETAIAPLLADAGVPAIVAMQAKVSMETVALIMPDFFREVASHGNIAHAMAVARRKAMANKRPDAWMPALFLRLKAGALWYTPGFGGSAADDDIAWEAICTADRNKALVPIIGQDLAEHILGTTSDFGAALAAKHGIPLSQTEKPDIARIAQAVQTKVGRATLYASLDSLFNDRLRAAANRLAPGKLRTPTVAQPLTQDEILEVITNALSADSSDPLNILASLDVKAFVSGSTDLILKRLLLDKRKLPYEICIDWKDETANGFDRVTTAAAALLALCEANPATPTEALLVRWEAEIVAAQKVTVLPVSLRGIRTALRDRLKANDRFPASPPKSRLDVVREWRQSYVDPPGDSANNPWPISTPLLYYAYGKKAIAETLVLTEDDFFDYLIQYSKFPLMPGMISSSLVEGSLLFLGFSLNDWKFRILFRLIMRQGGAKLLENPNYKHVGVQLDPDDYTPAEAIRLKRLLMLYFTASKINIFWGTSADFLRELQGRRQSTPVEEIIIGSE